MNRIRASYWIETGHPVEMAAEVLAGEQSSGTFLAVPGETPELKAKHGAVVESIRVTGEKSAPSLPGASDRGSGTVYRQAVIEVSWPIENMGINLPNLMATIAGNLFELNEFSGLRLLNVEIPESYKEKYRGPQFGIRGTRQLTGVYDRPVIGTIIKPSVGMSPQQTAAETGKLIAAGLDFLKDDELMGDSPHSPFEDRVEAVMKVINREADRSGRKAMFAFNISGDVDDMLRRHDFVMNKGGSCVMVSLNWIGISALVKLRSHSQLPIHGHRNGWGLMYRSPFIGIDFNAYQKIWRWAGTDHIHTNGLRNKFCESDDSVIVSIKACQEPGPGETVMPVISSGQWAGQAADTYRAIGNPDVMYLCGGGIVAHPSGIEAGVQSVRHAWEAALAGVSLDQYAMQSPALKEALDFFGKRTKK